MKLRVKIILILSLTFALIFVSTYIFLVFKGKSLIVDKLEDLTKKKVTVGYFAIKPPLVLMVSGLEIEGLAKVETITATPNIFALLTGKVLLDDVKLVKARITYEKSLSALSPASAAEPSISVPVSIYVNKIRNKHFFSHFLIKHLTLNDGRIDFLDRGVSKEGIKIIFKDVSLSLVNNYAFSGSAMSSFDLKAKIPWQKGEAEGKIDLKGWIDLTNKNMEAQVKIEDIDGIYLYPYYSAWLDLDKSRVEKANLDFTSNIHGLNNNVTADCHLELTDIVFKPLAESARGREEVIASAVIDIFKAMDQGKIVLNFTLKTRMDRPEFGFSQIKMAFKNKITQARGPGIKAEDVVSFPLKFLEGVVTGFRDISKAVISGTVAVGEEIAKATKGTAEE